MIAAADEVAGGFFHTVFERCFSAVLLNTRVRASAISSPDKRGISARKTYAHNARSFDIAVTVGFAR